MLKIGLIVTFALGVVHCEKSQSPKERQKQKRLEKLRKKVDLPEAPPQKSFQIQRKNTDGTLKIKALTFFPSDYLDQTVEAKGVIQKVGGDCKPGEDKNCPKPHLEVADSTNSDDILMVVGLPKSKLDQFEPGQKHIFKGKFKKSAFGFSAAHAGVIEVKEVDGESITDR